MKNALQREESAKPEIRKDEFLTDPDTIPINRMAADLRSAEMRLAREQFLCEEFLKSGNVIDGPDMDKPVGQVRSKISQVRAALTQITELKIGDSDFDKKLNDILSSVFPNAGDRT